MRQLIEPNVSASRRPSTFDPEALAHHNSPPHWAPSSSVPGEQTTSTSTAPGQRTSFSGPSPFSSLCLSVLAATPQPRMVCLCLLILLLVLFILAQNFTLLLLISFPVPYSPNNSYISDQCENCDDSRRSKYSNREYQIFSKERKSSQET
uniref:Uncharacterized protein n=1 Tax=Caenorhabditis tropicalis TaxID=1561998 RepID=A0A1I7TJT1_9PELO